MFDKIQFDRNAFDRSVSSDETRINISSSGSLQIVFSFSTPLSIALSGSGNLSPGLYASALFNIQFTGTSQMADTAVILSQPSQIAISSVGTLSSGLVMRIPMGATLSGSSGCSADNRVISIQNFEVSLSGTGNTDPQIINAVLLETASFQSSGTMQVSSARFSMPLGINLSGTSQLVLRRLSALNEKSFMLENINLLPGQTVIIDTDLLVVLFDNIEDVSSVTTDSVFFELSPGENEITINTDSNQPMNVTAIWQNRWL